MCLWHLLMRLSPSHLAEAVVVGDTSRVAQLLLSMVQKDQSCRPEDLECLESLDGVYFLSGQGLPRCVVDGRENCA